MEKAHDISLDEPCVAHQAILFMLDVLMRNNKPTLTLAELYDSFGDKSFTPQMLRAVGGNEQGLKQFLIRYPSLFTVNGDLISANSGGSQLPRNSTTPERYLRKTKSAKATVTSPSTATDNNGTNPDGSSSSSSSSGDLVNSSTSSSSSTTSSLSTGNTASTPAEPVQYDSKTMKEIEQEAIVFFRKQISKREEDWLPIVSVAGHASQSSSDVRKFVGPQNEFKTFLVRYPHVFVVRDEFCGLKGRADVSTQPFPPPSPPPKRRLPASVSIIGNGLGTTAALLSSTGTILTRNHSFKNTNRYSAVGNLMSNGTISLSSAALINSQAMLNNNNSNNSNGLLNNSNSNNPNSVANVSSINPATGMSKPRLTPVEVKAVHYVMRILHKNGRMLLQTIPGLISRAPDQVSNIVGFTREDLIQFFKRHSAIFQLHPDGCVSVKQDAVKALILKDSNGGSNTSSNSVNNTNGNVLNANSSGNLNSNSISASDSNGVITNNGVVLRIFPKYGILNMENNEQVFFDIQSCQFETFSDLTTILHTGDKLYFNAIIGPRDGSTKWRSLKTWIKMRPQTTTGVNMLETMSDAEKSDDNSSTSSSHGLYSRHHNGRQQGSYMNQALFYQNGNGGGNNGTNLYASGQTTPTQSLGLFSSSNSSSPIANASNNLIINSGSHQHNQGDENDPSGSISSVTSAQITNVNSLLNSSNHGSGDFNQYQLESGDSSAHQLTSLNGVVIDENAESSSSSSPSSNHSTTNLAHSTSANSLNHSTLNPTTTITTVPIASKQLVSSKSIHSFSSSDIVVSSDTAELLKMAKSSEDATASLVTKFMKQSADNISQRETLINGSGEKEMVSIGCQTISTGEVSVTNVYIE